ncbi:hypothetical protein ACWGNE_23045 [Streptomyces xiamenensis]
MSRHLSVPLVVMALAGCSLLASAPEGHRVAPPEFAHEEIGDAGWAHTQAESFMAWVRLMGTDEQRRVVEGSIVAIAGEWSGSSGLALILTDHSDSGAARTVSEAFGQWESNADEDVPVAVYGASQELLYSHHVEGGDQ